MVIVNRKYYMVINSVNSRIRALREKLRLSQGKFGGYIGLKQSSISNFETDGTTIKEYFLSAIERTFLVNPQWLREGEGDMGMVSLPDERTKSYNIPDHPAELRAPYKLGREIGELDQGVVQVLLMTLEVLRSGTHYAESLMQNIQSFHAAVSGERAAEEREQRIEERERLLAARERALEDRVGLIERKLEHIEHLAPPGGESPNFPAPGASEPGPSDVPGPDKDTK